MGHQSFQTPYHTFLIHAPVVAIRTEDNIRWKALKKLLLLGAAKLMMSGFPPVSDV